MSGTSSDTRTEPSKVAHLIRILALPIILGWLALTVITNVAVPSLEEVGEAHTVSMNAKDAPSAVSMREIGSTFKEFKSDSAAMVILEGEQPLGADAHHFYDELIKKFEADTAHVEHVADFWGDPLTASGAQSNDGKSAYVQLYLHGNMGETLANDSVTAVRDIVDKTPAPPGVKAYVTGGAPLISDQRDAGDKSIAMVTVDHARRDPRDAADRLPVHQDHDPDPADGVRRTGCRARDRRVPRLLRDHRALDVRDELADPDGHRRGHRLRDLPHRSISGGPRSG